MKELPVRLVETIQRDYAGSLDPRCDFGAANLCPEAFARVYLIDTFQCNRKS